MATPIKQRADITSAVPATSHVTFYPTGVNGAQIQLAPIADFSESVLVEALSGAPTYADNPTAFAALGAGKLYKTAAGGLFVTEEVVAPTGNVYWGERLEGSEPLTNAQIKATTQHPYTPGADITVTFANVTPKILWVAFPSTETGIAFYFANAFDKGPLSGSAFAQTTVGDLTVLTTQYGTQFPDPVVFRHTAA